MKHIAESTIVGLLFLLTMKITIKILFELKLPENELKYKSLYKTFNDNSIVIDISIFLTGFLVHLIVIFFCINKIHCKNGILCCG